MSSVSQLPQGFEALDPFVAQWAISTTAERAQRRTDSTPEEREAFFAAAKDLVEPALAMLDAKPLKELDEKERRLLDLMMSLAHVSLAVEVHREMEPRHAKLREAMVITRSVTDPV
jgi:hypothetical protein